MMEEQEKNIYELELHEFLHMQYLQVIRVDGGWLYKVWNDDLQNYSNPTFVPFNNERIKPLLKKVDVRDRKLKEANERITELEAENKKLDNALGEAQWSSNDFEAQLMQANEQITFLKDQIKKLALQASEQYAKGFNHGKEQLEAEKLREFGIVFNEGRLHRKANQIDVPFKVDEEDYVVFGEHYYYLSNYCSDNNIDTNQIERITLTMREE
jgi:DNA repair exonuclease SbcCD ATPase subunit